MKCHTFEQLSVDYLEGTLAPQDVRDADAHLQHCAHCRAMLAEARMLSEALRRLPQESCPDHVIEQVLASQGTQTPRISWIERFRQWLGPAPVWKAGMATAAVLLVAVAALWLYQDDTLRTASTDTYSAAEVEQAKREIELTLAYLHHYTQQTSTIVEYQLASTQEVLTQPAQTLLNEHLRATQTAVRRPMQTLIHDAAAPFEAAVSYLGEKL